MFNRNVSFKSVFATGILIASSALVGCKKEEPTPPSKTPTNNAATPATAPANLPTTKPSGSTGTTPSASTKPGGTIMPPLPQISPPSIPSSMPSLPSMTPTTGAATRPALPKLPDFNK